MASAMASAEEISSINGVNGVAASKRKYRHVYQMRKAIEASAKKMTWQPSVKERKRK